MARLTWKIRGLNPNSPSWLNHLHHYGAPPWWSQHKTHPMWVEHIWKDMSPFPAPPPPPLKCVTKNLANFIQIRFSMLKFIFIVQDLKDLMNSLISLMKVHNWTLKLMWRLLGPPILVILLISAFVKYFYMILGPFTNLKLHFGQIRGCRLYIDQIYQQIYLFIRFLWFLVRSNK